MKISPRCIWIALLAVFFSGCASLQKSSRFSEFTTPAQALCSAGERLREETREYLKEEDRWFPKGRDISLWESAQMVSVSGRNLQNGLTNTHLSAQELMDLVANAQRHFSAFEYWTANVKVNENILRAMNEVRSPLEVIEKNAKALSHDENSKAKKSFRKTSSSARAAGSSSAPFSPNDLNSAVSIAKAYLLQKYGIRNETIGNMRCAEKSNHHEVVLETRQTGYLLKVDVRRGKVVNEKSYPKAPRNGR